MSALLPIQWTEQEKTSGAVSFSHHIAELHDKLTTSTTAPSPAVSTTSRSTVEKIAHVVETVVPQIVETLQHEFVEPTTTVVGTGVTTTSPTTIHFTATPTTTTTSFIPPPDCRPTDNVQASLYFLLFILLVM
jgi:hypothetical protein